MSMGAAKTGKITLNDAEMGGLTWIKAMASNHNGACVEIAAASGNIALRDSKDPAGPVLVYTPAEFAAFLDGARNGEFDGLLRGPVALAAVGPVGGAGIAEQRLVG
jgi:hypothetical protein